MTEIEDNFKHRINPVSINLATLEFLKEYIDNNEVRSILEFGSGVSTEFWSEQLSQAHVISYENSRRYRKITASRVNKKADNIHVRFGPLRIMKLFGRRYISYKTGNHLKKYAPKSFDLVLIDGPPGFLYSREATLLQAIDQAFVNRLPSVLSNVFNRSVFPLYNNNQKIIQQSINTFPVTVKNKPCCIIQITDVSAVVAREKALERKVLERKKQSK